MGGHVFEALPERDDGEPETFEVLAHLDCTPPGVGVFANVVAHAELLDGVLDRFVVDDVAFGGEEALCVAHRS